MPSGVLIADDHALFRVAIGTLLASEPDLEVVGEAADGEEALALCRKLRPDLVLMDVSMPGIGGIAATRTIKAEFPKTGVLVMTAHAKEELLLEAIRAGAAGYLLKTASPAELIGAIRGTLGGESPVDQELVMRLVRQLAGEIGRGKERRAPARASLTAREIEVLELLATGQTNRQIAIELHLSLSTVKRNLERIISKLGVSDRTQAAVKAVELGLIDPTQG